MEEEVETLGCAVIKLDDSHRQLVESCHLLAIKLAHTYARSAPNELDEMLSSANVALCTAAYRYNSNLGNKFSTFAYKCITNALRNSLRKLGRQKDHIINIASEEVLGIKLDPHDTLALQEVWAITDLTERQNEVLSMYLEGFDSPHIASKLNVSKQNVHHCRVRALIKLRKQAHELGYTFLDNIQEADDE